MILGAVERREIKPIGFNLGAIGNIKANRMKNGESAFYVGDSGEYGALNWFKAWSKYFGDKAVRVNNTWTIQTTQAESTGGCVKTGADRKSTRLNSSHT